MRREFVPEELIDVYSKGELQGGRGYHFPDENGELVRVSKTDGKTLQEHLDGIEYIRELAERGTKILPPLLRREPNGRFKKLDGFKRILGMRAAGMTMLECFVCEPEDMGKQFWYDGRKITCKSGGQPYSSFTKAVEYGEDDKSQKRGGKIQYLYNGESLRLEFRENIHLHWGKAGRYRLGLGITDFKILAEAFANG